MSDLALALTLIAVMFALLGVAGLFEKWADRQDRRRVEVPAHLRSQVRLLTVREKDRLHLADLVEAHRLLDAEGEAIPGEETA